MSSASARRAAARMRNWDIYDDEGVQEVAKVIDREMQTERKAAKALKEQCQHALTLCNCIGREQSIIGYDGNPETDFCLMDTLRAALKQAEEAGL